MSTSTLARARCLRSRVSEPYSLTLYRKTRLNMALHYYTGILGWLGRFQKVLYEPKMWRHARIILHLTLLAALASHNPWTHFRYHARRRWWWWCNPSTEYSSEANKKIQNQVCRIEVSILNWVYV